jgi:hypothetical protein
MCAGMLARYSSNIWMGAVRQYLVSGLVAPALPILFELLSLDVLALGRSVQGVVHWTSLLAFIRGVCRV